VAEVFSPSPPEAAASGVVNDTDEAVSAPADTVASVLDPVTLSTLPTYKLFWALMPPEVMIAPVVVDVASVVRLEWMLPLAPMFPCAFRFSCVEMPPTTVKAPVFVVVLLVALLIVTAPVCVVVPVTVAFPAMLTSPPTYMSPVRPAPPRTASAADVDDVAGMPEPTVRPVFDCAPATQSDDSKVFRVSVVESNTSCDAGGVWVLEPVVYLTVFDQRKSSMYPIWPSPVLFIPIAQYPYVTVAVPEFRAVEELTMSTLELLVPLWT
jgi:hypothetical protein